MKCIHCGKSPNTHGVTLIRQNEKGVPGIWACESCNTIPVPDDLALPIAIIQRIQQTSKDNNGQNN